ncbi:ribonuclease H-like domain-containing protein [Myxococcus sp. AM009]|uniref:ribonuclease H-like domain-containing protein n=1 Tax=unclassified Myxococcus TaxID=2648731 RepID=UPI00159574B2|nr:MULTISPECIES: ribonuclease H-like domain-containing protein [unclassified Myxococcus]NVI99169.1 ribonuclease H-like domain-containing protein [Myxococcus sp. AM009]NVJ15604.1 ribonuclease H-like domain-containing protein [Myxococcus sp. AM010]
MDLKRKLARLTSVGPGGKSPPKPPVAEPQAEPAARAEARPATGAELGVPDALAAQLAKLVQARRMDESSMPGAKAGVPDAPAEQPSPPSAPRDPRIDSLRRMLSDWSERQGVAAARRGTPPRAPPGPLPVESRATAHGTVHVSERILAPEHHHGSAPLAAALDVEGSLVASLALHADLAGVDFQRMLFLDTETTGLAGGTGTVPFLVGLAWFEGRSLKVHQLFLRRLGEEAPMLRSLAERMAESSCLVTFNGKSFDWPLLRTRFVLNRVPAPAELPHLDLLHCARRVFKHRGAGTRLVHLEDQVLGFRRVDDVDGSLIPDLYFRYLRGGDGSALTPVLEHNVNDLLLLAALLGELVRRFRAGGPGASVPRDADPRDLLGFAGVALRARDYERAQAFARAAAAGDAGAVGIEALALASRLSRKAGDAVTAAAHLHQALKTAQGFQAATLHLQLTKLYEHGLKDLARALHHAKLASAAELPVDHHRRLLRLETRLARSTRAASLDLGMGSPRSGT